MVSNGNLSDELLVFARDSDSEEQPCPPKGSSNCQLEDNLKSSQRRIRLLEPVAPDQMQSHPPCPALCFYSLDNTFVPKKIALGAGVHVPIGRTTDESTVPSPQNGYFDSLVVSRQHAEVWEDGGRVFIQDLKSTNGTFINGHRLFPEPHELKSDDTVEFGVPVFGDGKGTILHHRVSARVLVVITSEDDRAAAREHHSYLDSHQATDSTTEARSSSNINSIFTLPNYLLDWEPHSPATPQIHPTSIEPSATTSAIAVIGIQTPTEDVVSCLVTHGCKDLTRAIDLATFDKHPISGGGYGDIYYGRMLDGTQVAVKTLKIFVGVTDKNSKALKHSAKELYAWSKCKHPNVLELLGLAVFRNQIGMVAPWMTDGNLPKYLERVPNVNRCKLCVRICDGLSYLHDIGIIHGDLKGTNVLISGNGTPLLTDFGNSVLAERTLQFTTTTESSSMTMRWSAPELITGSDTYSKAADVYALGMTLLETMTGMPPYHGKPERAIMYTVAVKRELPEQPEERIPTNSKDGNKLWDLLVTCWAFEPGERPSASVVAENMRIITQEGLIPVESPELM